MQNERGNRQYSVQSTPERYYSSDRRNNSIASVRGHNTPRSPVRERNTLRSPTRGHYTPRSPTRGYYTPRSPTRGHYTPRSPTRGHYTPRSPSRGHNPPWSPTRGHYTIRSPTRGHNNPRSPTRGHNNPRSPTRGHNNPRSPTRGHNNPRSPTRGHNNPRSPTRGHNNPRSPVRRYNTPRSPTRGHNNPRSPVRRYNTPRSPTRGYYAQSPIFGGHNFQIPLFGGRSFQVPLNVGQNFQVPVIGGLNRQRSSDEQYNSQSASTIFNYPIVSTIYDNPTASAAYNFPTEPLVDVIPRTTFEEYSILSASNVTCTSTIVYNTQSTFTVARSYNRGLYNRSTSNRGSYIPSTSTVVYNSTNASNEEFNHPTTFNKGYTRQDQEVNERTVYSNPRLVATTSVVCRRSRRWLNSSRSINPNIMLLYFNFRRNHDCGCDECLFRNAIHFEWWLALIAGVPLPTGISFFTPLIGTELCRLEPWCLFDVQNDQRIVIQLTRIAYTTGRPFTVSTAFFSRRFFREMYYTAAERALDSY